MRVKFWIKTFLFVPALCLAGLSTAAQQTGDPVADAARKAREAKKDTTKPKKVYTDDDFKKSVPEQAAPNAATSDASGKAAGATGQGAGTSGKAGDEPKEDPNSESAWRKRFQAQRDKITKAEKELDILTRELEKAQVEYYPDPQKAMQQQNTRADINSINAKINAKKQELDQLKQGMSDLEDQLRKSGGNAGWAR
jgi:chromosome segregation ATPase